MTTQKIIKSIFYPPTSDQNKGADLIYSAIINDKPLMVARFGSVEIKAILYPRLPKFVRQFLKEKIFSTMANNAGFFSITDESILKFSEMMIKDMQELDILGSWRIEEKFLLKYFPFAKRVALESLEPYLSNKPWTETLSGLRVLVVHPFNTTIESQYHMNRTLLFNDNRVLPEFKSLETIKSIQTIAGNESEFDTWFDALEYMKTAIDAKDYDVAILGCGAYGFPLAAHIKRTGKKAIHLGGATQILFGIKGKRWDDNHTISSFYNAHWIRPRSEDIPINANKVENGCYW